MYLICFKNHTRETAKWVLGLIPPTGTGKSSPILPPTAVVPILVFMFNLHHLKI